MDFIRIAAGFVAHYVTPAFRERRAGNANAADANEFHD
jgi:hypothetical protein